MLHHIYPCSVPIILWRKLLYIWPACEYVRCRHSAAESSRWISPAAPRSSPPCSSPKPRFSCENLLQNVHWLWHRRKALVTIMHMLKKMLYIQKKALSTIRRPGTKIRHFSQRSVSRKAKVFFPSTTLLVHDLLVYQILFFYPPHSWHSFPEPNHVIGDLKSKSGSLALSPSGG